MYHYTLRIEIFSSEDSIEEVLQAVLPLEGFTHQIERHTVLTPDKFAQSDWGICDRA